MDALKDFGNEVWEFAPKLLAALLWLVGGWIVATIAAGILRALFNRTTLDEKVAGFVAGEGKAPPLDKWISELLRWLIFLWAIVLAVESLGLEAATAPLTELLGTVTGWLPALVGALGLLVLGWLVATGVRFVVTKGVDKLGVEERLNKATGEEASDVALGKTIGTAVYWIVWLLFLVLILDALKLEGLLGPLQVMTTKVFAFLPNLFAAVIILAVGWFAATIIRRIVTSVTASLGVDSLADKASVKTGKGSLSGLLGTIAFIAVIFVTLTESLKKLQLEAVSDPMTSMLAKIWAAVPNLIYAAIIVGVAIVVGRLVAGLVSDLLARIGFDNILQKLGLSSAGAAELPEARRPSAIVGHIVLLAILLFASVEALAQLEMAALAETVQSFIDRALGWVVGLVIFGLGLWLANLVAGIIRDRGTPSSGLLATAARVAITVLAAIAALEEMQVAEDVVQWTAIVAIAAVGLAGSLAFGLGCRDQASKALDNWCERNCTDDE